VFYSFLFNGVSSLLLDIFIYSFILLLDLKFYFKTLYFYVLKAGALYLHNSRAQLTLQCSNVISFKLVPSHKLLHNHLKLSK
jgi:hypothetical protein